MDDGDTSTTTGAGGERARGGDSRDSRGVKLERLQIKAAQVKGAGNAYLPHYVWNWIEVSTCTLVSETIQETCTFTPPAPGTYGLTATIKDTQADAQHDHQTLGDRGGRGAVEDRSGS